MRANFLSITIIVFFTLSSGFSFAEQQEPWQRFQDEKSDLYGFKDMNQKVRIVPKFVMVYADKFNNIIAVVEQVDKDNYQSYYLLKSGEKVGKGNLYTFGNYFDCESEGKIRFRDKKLDRVGFFDKDGKVVIPAVYSDAAPFRNNMTMVKKGAERLCLDGKKYFAAKGEKGNDKRNCEHYRWGGGRSYLINTENEILINDFEHTSDLDWFSLKINEKKLDNPLRESFKGANGKYYSFINFKKEFAHWLESSFLLSDDLESLKPLLFKKVNFLNGDDKKYKNVEKDLFLKNNSKIILKMIKNLKGSKLKFENHRVPIGLMSLTLDVDLYSKYFDPCSNNKNWEYPPFDLVITHYSKDGEKKILYQDIFEFFKTVDGYRLIQLSLRSVGLKK